VTASPLEGRFRRESRQNGVPRDVIEKDFVLLYVLAGIAGVEHLASSLVFKGGTALRKCYFADYRYSEDLDFTAVDTSGAEALETALENAVAVSRELLQTVGAFDAEVDRYLQRGEHPDGQQAFRVHIRLPWQPRPMCSVKIEVTFEEPVLLESVVLPLIRGPEAVPDSVLSCYALEEIVAEKLRALLQTKAHIDRHGWARPRSRDYFDLWQLLVHRDVAIDRAVVGELLPRKCAVRGVGYAGAADFFAAEVIDRARADWNTDLPRLAGRVADFDACLRDLRVPVEKIVGLS
jgi:predicted nucleotidyltransferase component of viral defense system